MYNLLKYNPYILIYIIFNKKKKNKMFKNIIKC